VTVFEASNDTLKEFYLFVSARSLGAVLRAHCARPPREIAHWRKSQAIFYAEVEIFPDEELAWEFLERYVGTLERTGWKVLVQPAG
jgi:hypothetical protein